MCRTTKTTSNLRRILLENYSRQLPTLVLSACTVCMQCFRSYCFYTEGIYPENGIKRCVSINAQVFLLCQNKRMDDRKQRVRQGERATHCSIYFYVSPLLLSGLQPCCHHHATSPAQLIVFQEITAHSYSSLYVSSSFPVKERNHY